MQVVLTEKVKIVLSQETPRYAHPVQVRIISLPNIVVEIAVNKCRAEEIDYHVFIVHGIDRFAVFRVFLNRVVVFREQMTEEIDYCHRMLLNRHVLVKIIFSFNFSI